MKVLGMLCLGLALSAGAGADAWKESFSADGCKEFSSTGKGTYFRLEPGYRQVFEGREDGQAVRLEITVTEKTKVIGGIEARIVEEKESAGGELKEWTRDYMAVCKDSNSLIYLGEDVDNYAHGKITGHSGSWRHGRGGAHFGVLIPGKPELGMRFCQEKAPDAKDRAEILSLSETAKTPAGEFSGCLKTIESSPLEPGHQESKIYAPGIGQVFDGALALMEQEFSKK